jgi:hypothetical protein
VKDYLIAKPTMDDTIRLYNNIRPEDENEWIAGSGRTDTLTLLAEACVWDETYVIRHKDEPLVIAGIIPLKEAGACLGWMACTVDAPRHALALHYFIGPVFDSVGTRYDRIVCYADKRNKLHHKWMAWVGFDLMGETPYGPLQMPFLVFERLSNVHSRDWPAPRDDGGHGPSRGPGSRGPGGLQQPGRSVEAERHQRLGRRSR